MITTLLTCHKKVYCLSCVSVDVSCFYLSHWLSYIYNDDDILVYWLFISLVKTISYIFSSVWVLQEVKSESFYSSKQYGYSKMSFIEIYLWFIGGLICIHIHQFVVVLELV